MKRLDRILAVVDPTSDVQPALEKARLLAQGSGAALELFICDFDPSLSGRPFADSARLRELRDEYLEERLEFLEELADDLRLADLPVETHVSWDNPVHRGIVRRVQQSAPDLVIKDTHHHSVIRRTLLTNTDWNLIRTCPAPLLLAKSQEWPAHPRILAALDPEHVGEPPAALDHELLTSAATLARYLDGEVYAVHAFLPAALLAAVTGAGGPPVVGSPSLTDVVERERGRIAAAIAEVAAQHGLPQDRIHLEHGSAADVLPRVSRSLPADILAMGAVSRSRLQELFVGSTAEIVLDRLACDVLVVKRPDTRIETPASGRHG